jgi:hypothetical protein
MVCGWLTTIFPSAMIAPPPWMSDPAIWDVLLGGLAFGCLGYLITCRGYFAKR